MEEKPDAVLIAGPTASGKSAFALEQAEKWNGTIINADSMQVYPVLRILTARPDDIDLARVPHMLYGHASLLKAYSVARWLEDVRYALDIIALDNRIPIFVGGTGLYFQALVEGLTIIPDIEPAVRSGLRQRLELDGISPLYAELNRCDPLVAEKLKPNDRQRILRALEVIQSTGQSIAAFQSLPNAMPVLEASSLQKFVLAPERSALHQRVERRLETMLDSGAIEEVKQLCEIDIPADHPVLKAIGVSQIREYLSGNLSRSDVVDKLIIATRRYAKRQSTWFRNQLDRTWVVCG